MQVPQVPCLRCLAATAAACSVLLGCFRLGYLAGLESERAPRMSQNRSNWWPAQTPLNHTSPKLFDSLFYVHSRKTGTSLLSVLRKYIRKCQEDPTKRRGYTCFGELGGGFVARMSRDGRDHFPYRAEQFNVSESEKQTAETCDGAFLNCLQKFYHCPFYTKRCRDNTNKVTMLREPFKWFDSYLDWQGHYVETLDDSFQKRLPFLGQAKFVSGAQNARDALKILQTQYVWWGLTDYWTVSMCLFHRELVGGEIEEDELPGFVLRQLF